MIWCMLVLQTQYTFPETGLIHQKQCRSKICYGTADILIQVRLRDKLFYIPDETKFERELMRLDFRL